MAEEKILKRSEVPEEYTWNLKDMFESDEAETAIKRTMLRCSTERIMLCDSTKFGRIGHVKLGNLEKVSTIITDRIPDIHWKRLLEEHHIRIVYC